MINILISEELNNIPDRILYGYLIDDEHLNIKIPIYKSLGVFNESVAIIIDVMKNSYKEKLSDHGRNEIFSNVKEIWILTGEKYSFDKTYGLFKIGVDVDAEKLPYVVIPF